MIKKIVPAYCLADVPWLIGTAAIYALFAKIILALYSTNSMISVFWPGAGISLAVVLLGGRKFWLGIYIGALLGGMWAGQSLTTSALVSIGSVLEALLGAWLLSRKGNFDVSLKSPRNYFRLCYLAGAISPCISAAIGIATLWHFGRLGTSNIAHEFVLWWMGDALGIIFIAPLVLAWRTLPIKPKCNWLEILVLLMCSFFIGQIVFLDWFHELFGLINHGYWVYLVVCWAAIRMGLHGVLLIMLITTMQALVGAHLGTGLFGNDLARTQLINFWSYTVILALIGIPLAIIFAERERITAELRASERRYSTLFENMPDGLSHCRMIFQDNVPIDYEFITVNPAYEKVTGLRDVIGRKMSEITPGYAQENQISLDTFGKVVRTGESIRWEHYFSAQDRWFSFAVYRSTPEEFICILENITERKRAEKELRKLSLVVEQAPVSIVITDLNACIEYANPAFSLITGYATSEVLGQNARIFKSNRTPQETYQALWATLATGNVWRGEFINQRKDGTTLIEDATIAPLRQADGTITHYVGIKIDITRLKRTLSELRENKARWQLAKMTAGLGIFDHNIASNTIEWDEQAREFWGIRQNEPFGYAEFIAGIHPDDRAATQATINQSHDPESTGKYYAEYRVINRINQSVRNIVASGHVHFENGRPIRAFGILRDITAQKQLEKEVQERRREMEVLVNRQIAVQTAAAIAHELNQPLVAVSAYSEAALRLLTRSTTSPEKLSRALEGARDQAHRAGRTLHELLDFLHQGEVTIEPVNLNEIIRAALAIAKESGYSGFHSVIELEPGLPPVLANRVQLQKVLVNLLYNGVEAMRSIKTPTAALTIKVKTSAERNMAQVTVQDSGPGFNADTAHRIFDPFFTTKPNGIGLGLAISRSLIEANGGQLWADIESGPGATFHFVLPFAS
ncbi:MAG: PAS domain S-box protein [Formivibrio sp.]|nr:PAS domain S-box protein [Formivibrio sp.]